MFFKVYVKQKDKLHIKDKTEIFMATILLQRLTAS